MTDEEFEKELDKMYDKLDQYQAKMEELGLIMYGDTGYYWRNPEEYEKDKKICELESNIERLEYLLENKKIEFTDTINFVETSEPHIVANELDRLNEQLAEKDKELAEFSDINNALNSGLKEKCIFCEEQHYQDKIDFAVEQLERFRDIMEKLNENNSGYIIRFSSMSDREKFHEALDQLITEIKEGK